MSLHRAVGNNNIKEVERIIKQDPTKINEKDNDGWTPLHFAAEYGKLDIVKLLLEHGAKVDEKTNGGLTPLHRATHSKIGIVKLLLDNGAKVNEKSNYNCTDECKAIIATNPPIGISN